MANYCKGLTPFQQFKKAIIPFIITFTVFILAFYILAPAFNAGGIKSKSKNKMNPWAIIITLFIVLGFIIWLANYYFYSQTVILGRQERCMNGFTASQGYTAKGNDIPTKYYNPYYQKELLLLMRDMYILGAEHATFPCGQNQDLSNNESLREILRRNARWIEFDLRWFAQTPLDQEAEPVFATGSPGSSEPKTLPQIPEWLAKYSGGFFKRDNQIRWVKIRESLEICRDEAFRSTNAPLFIVLNSSELLDTVLLPNYFLESRIASIWTQVFYNRLPLPGHRGLRTPLAEVPVQDSFGKVFLIVNWKPQDNKFIELISERIMPENDSYPERGIQNVVLKQSDMRYGGLRSKFVNANEMIEYNKLHMTRVVYQQPVGLSNVISPGSDMLNVNLLEAKDFGMNVWPQNFGDFPGKDDCFKKSLEFFKDGCMKVKPLEQRYIPKPAPSIQKQLPELSYAQKFTGDPTRPGWADFAY